MGDRTIYVLPSEDGTELFVFFNYPEKLYKTRPQPKGKVFPLKLTDEDKLTFFGCLKKSLVDAFTTAGYSQILLSGYQWNSPWDACYGVTYKGNMDHAWNFHKGHRKLNHFPLFHSLSYKDILAQRLACMERICGLPFKGIAPETFIFPDEVDKFIAASAADHSARWISKPYAKSRGEGIRLWDRGPEQAAACARLALDVVTHKQSKKEVTETSDISNCTVFERELRKKHNLFAQPDDESKVIVQRYIADPFLLDGLKFDLRLYVAVTSVDPLCIYLFDDGLARFCTEKYDPSIPFPTNDDTRQVKPDVKGQTGGTKFAHLTNSSVNVYSDKYIRNTGTTEEEMKRGSKRSLAVTLERIGLLPGIDGTKLWSDISNLVTKSFIAFEPLIVSESRRLGYKADNGYELFGIDIMLVNGKTNDSVVSLSKTSPQPVPILIELNYQPQIDAAMPMDVLIKGTMMTDLMHLVGHKLPPALDKRFRAKYRNQIGNKNNGADVGAGSSWFSDKTDPSISIDFTNKRKPEVYNGRTCPANEHPEYIKFFKMIRMGLPRSLVIQKMKQETQMRGLRPFLVFDTTALDDPTKLVPWPEPGADCGSGDNDLEIPLNEEKCPTSQRDLFEKFRTIESCMHTKENDTEYSCIINHKAQIDDSSFIKQLSEEYRRIGHWHHIFPRVNASVIDCAEFAEMFSTRESRERYKNLATHLREAYASGVLSIPQPMSMRSTD